MLKWQLRGVIMKAQIDKFGRIVIPKSIRDHFGLKTGAILIIEETKQTIILKIVENKSLIEVKKGIVVYTGEPLNDLEESVKRDRLERDEKLGKF